MSAETHSVLVDTIGGQRKRYIYDTAEDAEADFRAMSLQIGTEFEKVILDAPISRGADIVNDPKFGEV